MSQQSSPQNLQKVVLNKIHFTHLPHYGALKNYDEGKWIIFGTLTHREPTAPVTQLKHFRALMDTLGDLNGSHGKRLHWVVRAEMGSLGKLAEDGDVNPHWHLHFVLAVHKVTDAHHHKMTVKDARKFLHNAWKHGRRKIERYSKKRKHLGYTLKCWGGPKSEEWSDPVVISTALNTHLKGQKLADDYAGRDALAVELLVELRKRDTQVWFGDEVPRWGVA